MRASMPALVTDVHIRSAVAGLRGLARAGIEVVALGPRRSAAGLWSRHVAGRAVGPDVAADRAGFVARLARLATEHGPLVVYPGWEGALEALLGAREGLPEQAVLPYPASESVNAIRDKRRLQALAREAGIETPRTLAAATARELTASPPQTPCVVKPMRGGGPLASATVARFEDELLALLRSLPDGERLLVQERISGPLIALSLVIRRDGEPAACFQQAARRTWPADAGASTTAVSVATDERLAARAAGMLATAGYWGLVELQFVETGGGPALIDANPRFYGSLPLALAAGVNLPAAWHAVTLDRALPSPGRYRVGMSYRWLEGDLSAALRGEPRRLLEGPPRPRVGAMWASDDPLPAALLAADAAAVRLRRRLLAN